MLCSDTKQELSPEQVVSQGLTFVIAGYETTSTAVSFAVSLLSRNPSVESKLLAEIDEFRGETPTFETMQKWPYTLARNSLPLICVISLARALTLQGAADACAHPSVLTLMMNRFAGGVSRNSAPLPHRADHAAASGCRRGARRAPSAAQLHGVCRHTCCA